MNQRPIILYVDDDEDDLEAFQSAVHEMNKDFVIVCAKDGEEGLVKLEELHEIGKVPALIVFDINMPGLDGKEFARQLNFDGWLNKIPVVALSTSDSAKEADFFKRYNVPMFTKPTNLNSLNEIIECLIALIGPGRHSS